MKIILIKDVKKQGKSGDILNVKDGYGTFLINKGDAVIIEKLKPKEKLEKGQVIAYQKDKRLIVHRIADISKQNGKEVYSGYLP